MVIYDRILLNATTIDRKGRQLKHQALAIHQGHFSWCGSMDDLPADYKRARLIEDCEGALITPGLIDCHTHLVYAGNRADEFKKRLQGISYAEIAKDGGGILSTVRETRAVSEEELLLQSLPRLNALQAEGVTTVEIKSGYGLDLKNELKILRVAKELGKITQVRVVPTFLGAHAVPPEYQSDSQSYIDYICSEVIPAVAAEKLANAVDIFCETIGFTLAQAEQIFLCAQQYGLALKCHAEQLSDSGAAKLAAEFKAFSCDHLEYLNNDGIQAMTKAGTVAVLLPGAFYFLRETRKPPVTLLRDAGVGIAIATDCNPGSSPTTSLLLMMNMACQFFSLTVEEALSAVTWQAARALGLEKNIGALEEGMTADLVRWSVQDAAQLCYQFGYPFTHETMMAGEWKNFEE